MRIDRAHFEGWVRLTVRIITDFSCVGQSPVEEKEDNTLDEIQRRTLLQ